MNIPKDTVVCYDNRTTTDLTVKGHLKVTGILTARHIQGGGTVEAGEVVCDTLEANTLRADVVTLRKAAVKKLFVRDFRASAAVVVSDFAECASLQTGQLTVSMFSIRDLSADEVILLTPKNRGMLGTLFAAWPRTPFSRKARQLNTKNKQPLSQKADPQKQAELEQLTDHVIREIERRGYFSSLQADKEAA